MVYTQDTIHAKPPLLLSSTRWGRQFIRKPLVQLGISDLHRHCASRPRSDSEDGLAYVQKISQIFTGTHICRDYWLSLPLFEGQQFIVSHKDLYAPPLRDDLLAQVSKGFETIYLQSAIYVSYDDFSDNCNIVLCGPANIFFALHNVCRNFTLTHVNEDPFVIAVHFIEESLFVAGLYAKQASRQVSSHPATHPRLTFRYSCRPNGFMSKLTPLASWIGQTGIAGSLLGPRQPQRR